MGHQHDGHPTRRSAAQANGTEREIIAHFPSADRAHQAEHHLAPQVSSLHVQEVTERRVDKELEAAPEGVSTVEIGWPAWAVLLLGAVIGAILGALVYANRIVIAGLAPALSAGPVAMGFLGAGVLGALGWLIGAVAHLFRTPHALAAYEVRAVVPVILIAPVAGVVIDRLPRKAVLVALDPLRALLVLALLFAQALADGFGFQALVQ